MFDQYRRRFGLAYKPNHKKILLPEGVDINFFGGEDNFNYELYKQVVEESGFQKVIDSLQTEAAKILSSLPQEERELKYESSLERGGYGYKTIPVLVSNNEEELLEAIENLFIGEKCPDELDHPDTWRKIYNKINSLLQEEIFSKYTFEKER